VVVVLTAPKISSWCKDDPHGNPFKQHLQAKHHQEKHVCFVEAASQFCGPEAWFIAADCQSDAVSDDHNQNKLVKSRMPDSEDGGFPQGVLLAEAEQRSGCQVCGKLLHMEARVI
jgi:hypothetical protein